MGEINIINVKLSQEIKEIKIFPIGDVHYGSKEFNATKWNSVLTSLKENDDLYCTLGGDLIENVTLGSKGDIFTQTATPHQQIDKLVKDLCPIKHKILAIIPGNHELRTYRQTGFMPSLYLANMLGLNTDENTRYSSNSCLIYISFGKNQGRKNIYYTFSISLTHGSGGSTTPGGKINKLLKGKEIISNADVYIHHHTHEPIMTFKGSFYADTRTKGIYYHEGLFVNSSSFLDYGGYSLEKEYSPSSKRDLIIVLSVDENDRKNPKRTNLITRI